MQRFGETPRLLQHLTPIKCSSGSQVLLDVARYCNQLWATTLCVPSTRPGNQLNTYEHNGDAHWLEYLHPTIKKSSLAQQEYSNYMLQLASIESSRYSDVNQKYISALRKLQISHVVVTPVLVGLI